MKALQLFLADGSTCLTEAHDDACVHSLEISNAVVDVPEGTLCDICDEEITEAEIESQDSSNERGTANGNRSSA